MIYFSIFTMIILVTCWLCTQNEVAPPTRQKWGTVLCYHWPEKGRVI